MQSLSRFLPLTHSFQALQVLVFFASVVTLLYYYGIIQYLLKRMAHIMQLTLGTTAVESLNACSCVFLGQVTYFSYFSNNNYDSNKNRSSFLATQTFNGLEPTQIPSFYHRSKSIASEILTFFGPTQSAKSNGLRELRYLGAFNVNRSMQRIQNV